MISDVLDEHPELTRAVVADLERGGALPADCRMTPEQVLRAFVLREINGWDSEALEYPLADRLSYQQFCRTDSLFPNFYSKATLEANLKRVGNATIEALHDVLLNRRDD